MAGSNDFQIEDGALVKYTGTGTEVIIPDGVTEIGMSAFYHCPSLESVIIPAGVTKIEANAFGGCTSLTSVTIPESVTEIGDQAFQGCGISDLSHPCLTIRNGFVITDGALMYCTTGTITEVTIPEGVTKIDNFAFFSFKSLESAIIPEGVTEIGWNAFRLCTALKSVSIPKSMEIIGWNAFEGCTALTEIHYAGTSAQWNDIEKDDDWHKGVPAKDVLARKGL